MVRQESVLSKCKAGIGTGIISKFEKRLTEEYDVVLEYLGSLDEQARNEYINWKAWRAAILCEENKDSMDHNTELGNGDNISDLDTDETDKDAEY